MHDPFGVLELAFHNPRVVRGAFEAGRKVREVDEFVLHGGLRGDR
jgi:hypothetical protein